MRVSELRALCAAILRAELEPDGINVTADEKTAYAVEQSDRLLAALGIAQEEPVSNADELVALRAKLKEAVGIAQKFAEAARDACIAGLAQSAKLRQAEVRIAELEASLAEADMWAVDHCEYVAPEAHDALEAKVRELEALVRLLKADAADGTANQHYLDGAEAFADWAAEDNDFPSTDASFEDWKDRGLRAADRSGSALLGDGGDA